MVIGTLMLSGLLLATLALLSVVLGFGACRSVFAGSVGSEKSGAASMLGLLA